MLQSAFGFISPKNPEVHEAHLPAMKPGWEKAPVFVSAPRLSSRPDTTAFASE